MRKAFLNNWRPVLTSGRGMAVTTSTINIHHTMLESVLHTIYKTEVPSGRLSVLARLALIMHNKNGPSSPTKA